VNIRRSGIAVVAFVLVLAAFAVADDLAPAFLIAGATSLLFLLTGVALFPRFRLRFSIPIPSAKLGDAETPSVRLADADIPLRPYIQVALCTLTRRHIPELVGCALIAVATLIIVGSGSASYRMLVTGWGLLALEGACIAGAMVLITCVAWADECRVLRRAHVTLAAISGVQSGLGHRQLTYEFYDETDVRYGGYTRSSNRPAQNAVFVFYNPNDPSQNRAHNSLFFHQIRVDSLAPLRLEEKSVDEQVPS
jgi:hypothetical protein